MYLSNLSQVLLRNDELLKANFPLLINMPDDELSQRLCDLNTNCDITFYDNNYELHQLHKKNINNQCIFSAQYQSEQIHDLVIINFPKSKKELSYTLAMLASHTTENSKILIIGENKSGIKSVSKLVKEQTIFCEKVDSARHCILFETQLSNHHVAFNIEDWFHYYHVNINNKTFKVAALPGVFSQAKLDVGSQILLENLSDDIYGEVLDFGCGAGVIACFIGLNNKNSTLTLADVSALALASSEKTLAINNLSGEIIATNSLSNISNKYQYVISNPPFHQGIKTHYAATEKFLAGIKEHIHKQGQLTIVANSFLKYQPIIEHSIGKTEKICIKQGFTIYQARLRH
ncbi:MAG: methyltransferase [Colwelliaceae bacterium]|jgi:16S rRNA (guanine1207-N2)-methyltransferase|nr:methyltransferase [Colwelliaceae bacterium]